MLCPSSRKDLWFGIFFLEGVIIICCNILGLVIFAKRARHSKPCILLANQCLADCLLGIQVVFHSYMHYTTYNGITTYQQMSKTIDRSSDCMSSVAFSLYTVLWILAMEESLISLALIALERVYAVFRPFQHRVLRRKTYFQAVIATWIITLTHSLSYIYRQCEQIGEELAVLFFGITSIITVCWVSALVISYSAIYIKLRFFPIFQNSSQTRNQFKLCRVLFYASLASVITFLPEAVVHFYMKINCSETSDCFPSYLAYIAEVFLFSNSFINFFIYVWRFPGFSESVRKLLCCRGEAPNRVQHLGIPG